MPRPRVNTWDSFCCAMNMTEQNMQTFSETTHYLRRIYTSTFTCIVHCLVLTFPGNNVYIFIMQHMLNMQKEYFTFVKTTVRISKVINHPFEIYEISN